VENSFELVFCTFVFHPGDVWGCVFLVLSLLESWVLAVCAVEFFLLSGIVCFLACLCVFKSCLWIFTTLLRAWVLRTDI
jgi:hypothetical protein